MKGQFQVQVQRVSAIAHSLLWHRKAETVPWQVLRRWALVGLHSTRVVRQVGLPWASINAQAIGILVGPTLPKAVRIGKEDLDREPACTPCVFRPHLSPNRPSVLSARRSDMLVPLMKPYLRTGGIHVVYPGQH